MLPESDAFSSAEPVRDALNAPWEDTGPDERVDSWLPAGAADPLTGPWTVLDETAASLDPAIEARGTLGALWGSSSGPEAEPRDALLGGWEGPSQWSSPRWGGDDREPTPAEHPTAEQSWWHAGLPSTPRWEVGQPADPLSTGWGDSGWTEAAFAGAGWPDAGFAAASDQGWTDSGWTDPLSTWSDPVGELRPTVPVADLEPWSLQPSDALTAPWPVQEDEPASPDRSTLAATATADTVIVAAVTDHAGVVDGPPTSPLTADPVWDWAAVWRAGDAAAAEQLQPEPVRTGSWSELEDTVESVVPLVTPPRWTELSTWVAPAPEMTLLVPGSASAVREACLSSSTSRSAARLAARQTRREVARTARAPGQLRTARAMDLRPRRRGLVVAAALAAAGALGGAAMVGEGLPDTSTDQAGAMFDASSLHAVSGLAAAGPGGGRVLTGSVAVAPASSRATTGRTATPRTAQSNAFRMVGVSRSQERGPIAGCSGVAPKGTFENGRLPASALCTLPWDSRHRLRLDAAARLIRLDAAYHAQFGVHICLSDSYRSLASQYSVAARKPGLAARPGTSEHGWGLAIDLCGGPDQPGSVRRAWMLKHAPAFGWDNPAWARPGGSKLEPWHWEFTEG